MQTTITQISNIFNLMVQAESRIEFYHFGWRSDINRNIDNNFDEGTKVGRKFPALHFDVPENTSISNVGLDYFGLQEDVQITLYFDDLQDYNNNSTEKIDTLLEQWTNLKTIAEDFVLNFEKVIVDRYGLGFINSDIKFIQRSNLHNDKLITWEVSFLMKHTTPCTLEDNQINLSLFPECIKEYDIENYKKDVPFRKTSLLFDGVNERLVAASAVPYDFESNQSWSVEFWIYPTQIQNARLMFHGISDGPSNSIQGWSSWILANGQMRFDIQQTGAFVNTLVTAGGTYVANQWNHIVFTYNGNLSNSGVRLYHDSISQPLTPLQDNLNGGTIKNAGPLEVFGSNLGFHLLGNGYSARVWNKVLSQSEVDQQFANICVDSSCPVDIVAPENNILNLETDISVFENDEWTVEDKSGTITDAISVNMEIDDKVEFSPCNP